MDIKTISILVAASVLAFAPASCGFSPNSDSDGAAGSSSAAVVGVSSSSVARNVSSSDLKENSSSSKKNKSSSSTSIKGSSASEIFSSAVVKSSSSAQNAVEERCQQELGRCYGGCTTAVCLRTCSSNYSICVESVSSSSVSSSSNITFVN